MFCWGVESNFVGSESGQIHSLFITPVYALHITPSPPPLLHTIECIDLYWYLFTQEGGGEEVNWKVGRGALVYKRGQKYQ